MEINYHEYWKKKTVALTGFVHFMHICHLFQTRPNTLCLLHETKDFLYENIKKLFNCCYFDIVIDIFEILLKYALLDRSCHVYGEGNQQTGLQGLLLQNYQHYHFHHILHLSKLPYQEQDLRAAQETTISPFWCTIKRCQTWFLLHCFGSGCQQIKHYLKEESFSREKGPARSTDGEEGAR